MVSLVTGLHYPTWKERFFSQVYRLLLALVLVLPTASVANIPTPPLLCSYRQPETFKNLSSFCKLVKNACSSDSVGCLYENVYYFSPSFSAWTFRISTSDYFVSSPHPGFIVEIREIDWRAFGLLTWEKSLLFWESVPLYTMVKPNFACAFNDV